MPCDPLTQKQISEGLGLGTPHETVAPVPSHGMTAERLDLIRRRLAKGPDHLDVISDLRFCVAEIERLTRELSIAKGGYQDPQFHDAVVISKARVTQFENEIERLTRDLHDYKSMNRDLNIRAEAAEARLAALSAPVDASPVLLLWLETNAEANVHENFSEALSLIRRLASSLAWVREDAAKIADNWVGACAHIGPLYDAGMSFAAQKIAESIRASPPLNQSGESTR